jgi:pimeloyl-ACP methyl ester carboxylesterase
LLLALSTATSSHGQEPQSGAKPPAYPDHARLLVVRDASGKERPVETPADWAVRRGHILGHLQEVMGPFPGEDRRADLDWKILSTHKEDGYVRHKIDFQSEPGDRVPAWLLIPDAPEGATAPVKRPAMLCLHQTIAIGKDEPAGLGKNPNLKYARELAERGYVTIAPDYPNYGEYQRDVYAMGYASASMKAIWNNTRAVDLLVSLPEVDPEKIGAIGHSLGGHNAIFTALFEPRIKAVVSSSGFNAFPYYYKGNIAGWSHKGYMPRLRDVYHLDLKEVPFDFPELIAALAPRPFFTNSPLHDDNFEVEGVRACLDAARPVYRLFEAEDDLQSVHPDAEHSFPPDARKAACEFLDRRLK